MKCPICIYKKTLTLKIKIPTFEHRNLKKISDYLILNQCKRCNIIYNPSINNISTIQKKIFLFNKDYNFLLKNNKISALKDSEYAKKIFHLSNVLIPQTKNFNVLDVGALEGNVLKQIRVYFNKNKVNNNKLNFVGYNYSNRKSFISHNNLIINSLKVEDCFKNNKKYNIIISINSLQYIKKINQFLLTIKNSLMDIKNFAFFVVPNSFNNFLYNFHGDEFYKFTKNNILILFARNGLKVNFLKNNINPDHLMFYVQKSNNCKIITKQKISILELPNIKDKINNFLTSVSKITFKFQNNTIKIFGYRINAVVLYYALIKFNFNSNKISFITDDNVKLGRGATMNNLLIFKKLIIYNKRNYLKIYNSLDSNEKIILSYGYKRNNVFKDILKKKYNFKDFLTI
jgi:hypothetical protein